MGLFATKRYTDHTVKSDQKGKARWFDARHQTEHMVEIREHRYSDYSAEVQLFFEEYMHGKVEESLTRFEESAGVELDREGDFTC